MVSSTRMQYDAKRKSQSSWEAEGDRYLVKKKQHPNLTALREAAGCKKAKDT